MPTYKYWKHRSLGEGGGDIPAVWAVAAGVCRGLRAMAERGLVHGDINAGNVFVSLDGAVKLADFGKSIPMQEFDSLRAIEPSADDRFAIARMLARLSTNAIPTGRNGELLSLPATVPADMQTLIHGLATPVHSGGMSLDAALAFIDARSSLMMPRKTMARRALIADEQRSFALDHSSADEVLPRPVRLNGAYGEPGTIRETHPAAGAAGRRDEPPARQFWTRPTQVLTLWSAGLAGATLMIVVFALRTPTVQPMASRTAVAPSHVAPFHVDDTRPEPRGNLTAEPPLLVQPDAGDVPGELRESTLPAADTLRTPVGERSQTLVRERIRPGESTPLVSGIRTPAGQTGSVENPGGRSEDERAFAQSELNQTDGFILDESFQLTGLSVVDGIEVTIDRGIWVTRDTAIIRARVRNRSSSDVHIAALRLVDDAGRSIPTSIEKTHAIVRQRGMLSVSVGIEGRFTLRVHGASRLSGNNLSLQITTSDRERSMEVSDIRWP